MNEILCWIKERALPTYANSRCLAKSYGQRKGITHAAWRSLGVPPDVLRKAGISRSD